MLVCRKIHFPATKRHAFHAKAQSLLRTRLEAEFDFATGTYNALPGKRVRWNRAKKSRHRSMIKGISSGRSHLSIRGNTTLWD